MHPSQHDIAMARAQMIFDCLCRDKMAQMTPDEVGIVRGRIYCEALAGWNCDWVRVDEEGVRLYFCGIQGDVSYDEDVFSVCASSNGDVIHAQSDSFGQLFNEFVNSINEYYALLPGESEGRDKGKHQAKGVRGNHRVIATKDGRITEI